MLMERQLAKQDPKQSEDSVALPMHASIRKPKTSHCEQVAETS